MVDRRGHAFLDPAASEPVHRQQVEAALQRLAKLIAANSSADTLLGNRVTEAEEDIEALGAAAVTLSNTAPVDVTGAAASAGAAADASRRDHRHDIDVDAVLDTVDSTRGTILSRGNTGWRGIDPGTATHVLTSNGAGADPTYQAASSGAPTDAQYVVLATHASLSAERVLTAGHGIDLPDSGANSPVTIDVDESELDLTGYATRFVARVPPLTINTDNTARSLLTSAIAIPANTLSTDNQQLRLTFFGNLLSNAAVGQTWVYILSLNGVTLIQDTSAAFSQSATRRPFRVDVFITRIDSTHAAASMIMCVSPVAAATTGLGDLATTGTVHVLSTSNTDVAGMDFTASQNLNITSQASSNSANMETRVQGGIVEAI